MSKIDFLLSTNAMVSAMFVMLSSGRSCFFLSDSDLQIQISKNGLHCLLQ